MCPCLLPDTKKSAGVGDPDYCEEKAKGKLGRSQRRRGNETFLGNGVILVAKK